MLHYLEDHYCHGLLLMLSCCASHMLYHCTVTAGRSTRHRCQRLETSHKISWRV